MEGSAAEKDAGFGFGDVEVADILADFGVVSAQEGAVSREGVDEIEDILCILEAGIADGGTAYPGTRGGG